VAKRVLGWDLVRINLRDTFMKVRFFAYLGMLLLVTPALSGCWLLAVGGAGAYGGYKMKEEGYKVQSPVTKEKPADEERKE
jgi:hypothetical protein